jgi:hypothetical protein
MKLQGYDQVMRNLNKEIGKIRKHTKAGLWEAGLVIKGNSVKRTPIDMGNLRSSCFVMVTDWQPDTQNGNFSGDDASRMANDHSRSKSEMKQVVEGANYSYSAVVAYSAHYAYWVHEMGEANWSAPGVESQFLIKAVQETKPRVLRTLAKHARF